MAFSNGLAKAGTPPTSLDTRADVEFTPGTGITGVCGDPNCMPITCNPAGGGQYCGQIGNGCGKALDCPATCPGGGSAPSCAGSRW